VEAIRSESYPFEVRILRGDGNLFWNGGMINSWKAALEEGGWDGYIWLNDDTVVFPEFWKDLQIADAYCQATYGKKGIYVGSTKNLETGAFTYGGFVYTNRFLLKDRMLPPDGSFQECEAGHGNITYVSSEVVDKMGIFCPKYRHGGTDHDYTYLAHKAGFPVLVMPHYAGGCENDHLGKPRKHVQGNLRQRLKLFWSPWGYNMHNTLLFNWRCFPWRVPFVFFATLNKVLFPTLGYKVYRRLRGVK
jgi:GT2 family glycosyltransferase